MSADPRKNELSCPPSLRAARWSLRGNSYHFAMHRHEELEVNLVTRGRATYLLANRRYDLRPGSQIWLFPDEDHVLLDLSPDYEMWLAVFTPKLLRSICTTDRYRVLTARKFSGQFCRRLDAELASRLETLFRDVSAATDDPNRCNVGLGYLLLTAWQAQGAVDVPVGRNVHPAVEKAATLIRDEAEPWTLESLALQVDLSPSRLSYLFKHQTGASLVQFRQRQRIERFSRLYGEGKSRTLLSAALDSGFGSYPQFHRVFKHYMRISPREYRRRLQRSR